MLHGGALEAQLTVGLCRATSVACQVCLERWKESESEVHLIMGGYELW